MPGWRVSITIIRVTVRSLHIVESRQPFAGSIAICVEGLAHALTDLGLDASIVDSASRWEDEVRNAGVIHIHGWGYELAKRVAKMARRLRRTYVISPLGALTPGPHNRRSLADRIRALFGERSLIQGAAALGALNVEDERMLRAANVHPRIRLLPYGLYSGEHESGVGAVASRSPEPDGTARHLLLLGPIDPVYGCVALLKAFAELGADGDGWNVVLAGRDSGNWRRMLEAAVRRKGGEDRVQFEDADSPARQRDLLGRASVVVAPSLHFGPGVSIMQAIRAGIPVVASTACVPPGLNGAVRVCGPSRAALREMLRKTLTLSDEQLRAATAPARENAKALLDWSKLVSTYTDLYCEIA